jgi:hypothetical protein
MATGFAGLSCPVVPRLVWGRVLARVGSVVSQWFLSKELASLKGRGAAIAVATRACRCSVSRAIEFGLTG